jgi:ATP-dependent RNA/DNA helicase IGHMBP2
VLPVSAYRLLLLRRTSWLRNVHGLEVDSAVGCWGNETEALVVSHVRSNAEGEIGFLADTRRTNVVLTRARRKLLFIGDGVTRFTGGG